MTEPIKELESGEQGPPSPSVESIIDALKTTNLPTSTPILLATDAEGNDFAPIGYVEEGFLIQYPGGELDYADAESYESNFPDGPDEGVKVSRVVCLYPV